MAESEQIEALKKKLLDAHLKSANAVAEFRHTPCKASELAMREAEGEFRVELGSIDELTAAKEVTAQGVETTDIKDWGAVVNRAEPMSWKGGLDNVSHKAELRPDPPEDMPAQQPAPAQRLSDAFDAGFRCAAGWAQRDDLFADIDSPTYKKDRLEHLNRIAEKNGITLGSEG